MRLGDFKLNAPGDLAKRSDRNLGELPMGLSLKTKTREKAPKVVNVWWPREDGDLQSKPDRSGLTWPHSPPAVGPKELFILSESWLPPLCNGSLIPKTTMRMKWHDRVNTLGPEHDTWSAFSKGLFGR